MILTYFRCSAPRMRLPINWLLAVKLTSLLFLVAILNVSASSFGQKVTFNTRNASLESVLQSLRVQTGFDYIADESLLHNAKPVSLSCKDLPLDEALKKIFAEQLLTYALNDHAIIIKPKIISVATNIDVTGKVTDEINQPLIGATIGIKHGHGATTTDEHGTFLLRNVPADAILVITFLGYEKRELAPTPDMGQIRLIRSNSKLDEVQVIAYGTNTQRFNIGSVSKVNGAAIERQTESNPILALEGQVPGLFITANTGVTGAQMSVNIRGQNSLNPTTAQPLYIIDGVPFGSQAVEQSSGGFMGAVGFSPLNTINPADIESITVLKDADATAIYGSRGAAGVILITTKKAKPGKTQFSLELSSGAGKATNMVKMYNTADYLAIRKQAFANDGVTPTATNAPDLIIWPANTNTDLAHLIMGQTSRQNNVAFSISGGSAQTQFIFGGNIRSQSSIFYNKTKDNSQQFNLGLQHKSQDGKFGLETSVNYNLDDNTIPQYTINYLSYSVPPNYPLYTDNGSLYFAPGYTNPLAAFNIINNMRTSNLMASATLHYTILPGLEIKAYGGYNKIDVRGAVITPASANNPNLNAFQTSNLNNNYIQSYIAEPQINYSHNWGNHRLGVLLGATWQESQNVQPYFIMGTFSNIQLAKSLNALNVLSKSSQDLDYKYVSGFTRLSYQFAEKYLVNLNVRRDGSSRFGPNRKFGNFGSVGAAWIFSNEYFAQQAMPWLSYGKLRASYGSIGNDRIQDYLYEPLYFPIGSSYGGINGYGPSRVTNPDLQWEVTKKLDLGLELGFFNSRVLFTAAAYRNRSSNLLGYTSLAGQTGFSGYTGNIPATIQNKGIELELNTVNIKRAVFRWSSALNVTIPHNKIIAFPGIAGSIYAYQYAIGKSLSYAPLYHFTGFKDGIATVEDVNKDGVIGSGMADYGAGDRTGNANSDPKVYGGFSNTINYKGFQLDILIQGTVRSSGRGDISLATIPGMNYNMPASMADIPVKYTATAGTTAYNAWQYYTGSDAAWQSAAYLRLRNVSIAYNLKPAWISKIKLSTCQVYLRGQNLVTITGYKGLDPETFNALPPMKLILAGLRTTF